MRVQAKAQTGEEVGSQPQLVEPSMCKQMWKSVQVCKCASKRKRAGEEGESTPVSWSTAARQCPFTPFVIDNCGTLEMPCKYRYHQYQCQFIPIPNAILYQYQIYQCHSIPITMIPMPFYTNTNNKTCNSEPIPTNPMPFYTNNTNATLYQYQQY